MPKGDFKCFRYIESLVCEFNEDDDTRKKHYNDLKYTCFIIFNEIVTAIKKGAFKDVYRKVLDTSKVIQETTMMEERMKADINTYKQELFYWHLDDDNKMCYKIPTAAKTLLRFRKKNCKAKDYAIEIVTKMYRINQEERVDMKREINGGSAGDICA
jgi:hypothetical protein